VIEDLDGAATEPSRRWHVALLSAALAAFSLVLLVVLVGPPANLSDTPHAASPAPSAAPATTVTFSSNPISRLRIDLTHEAACADGTRLIPPYYISVDAATGGMSAARVDGTDRAVGIALVFNPETGWINVSCATPLRVVTGDIFILRRPDSWAPAER
jgi:hypothetical protein